MKIKLLILLLFISTIGLSQKYSIYVDNRDSKTYQTILIDSLIWFVDNLNYEIETSYIPNVKKNKSKYGRLYTYRIAKYVCPQGWRLPTKSEWVNLNQKLTDKSEFTEKMLGLRKPSGNYYFFDLNGYYWSSTEENNGYHWYVTIMKNNNKFNYMYQSDEHAFAVRCVKNNK